MAGAQVVLQVPGSPLIIWEFKRSQAALPSYANSSGFKQPPYHMGMQVVPCSPPYHMGVQLAQAAPYRLGIQVVPGSPEHMGIHVVPGSSPSIGAL